MSGKTHGAGPNPPGDDPLLAPHPEAGGDIAPQAPLFLCPIPPGRKPFSFKSDALSFHQSGTSTGTILVPNSKQVLSVLDLLVEARTACAVVVQMVY